MPAGDPTQNPQVQAVIQALANGVFNEFMKRIPPGAFLDPGSPQIVIRRNVNGEPEAQSTSICQQLAELNDNILDLNDLTEESLDLIEKRKKKRRRDRD